MRHILSPVPSVCLSSLCTPPTLPLPLLTLRARRYAATLGARPSPLPGCAICPAAACPVDGPPGLGGKTSSPGLLCLGQDVGHPGEARRVARNGHTRVQS